MLSTDQERVLAAVGTRYFSASARPRRCGSAVMCGHDLAGDVCLRIEVDADGLLLSGREALPIVEADGGDELEALRRLEALTRDAVAHEALELQQIAVEALAA